MRIEDLMTRNVMTVNLNDRASTAGRLMWECDCGAIPVVDDSGRAIGMITDRDICISAVLQDRSPSTIPVSDAMSRELHACMAEDEVASAEDLMRRHQVRRLPVLDVDGHPVGILSLADVVRAAGDGSPRRSSRVSHDVTITLANICEPRAPM
ncbi:MAG TPA: CBS domain-containing protein [Polyangia bacterium]|nr:CBS domain-containing protein [Polyangia bacterium]